MSTNSVCNLFSFAPMKNYQPGLRSEYYATFYFRKALFNQWDKRNILKVFFIDKIFWLNLNLAVRKKFVLDCSRIAGRYNSDSIIINHDNGNLAVLYTNSMRINMGKIRPSCDGYMTFGNNERKEFKFNEKKREIIWNGPDAEDKWIQGCFY